MFNFSGTGTRKGVIAQIQEAKSISADGKPAPDQSQAEAVKALLIAEIKALPANVNGCQVHVEADEHKGGRTIQVNIIAKNLHV